jgi:hypothetical protein
MSDGYDGIVTGWMDPIGDVILSKWYGLVNGVYVLMLRGVIGSSLSGWEVVVYVGAMDIVKSCRLRRLDCSRHLSAYWSSCLIACRLACVWFSL